MATRSTDTFSVPDRQWYIVGRWQEYEGEGRANLLRIAAVGAFYLVELFHHYALLDAAHRETWANFHAAATALAAAWTLIALAVLVCLRQQIFPAFLKYVSTACDVVLLTALAMLATGPQSPLVFVYFVLVALAGIRFSLGLVWCATAGSMLGYLFLLGHAKWFLPAGVDHGVPRVEQAIVLLSLALAGVVLGQTVRRVRALSDEYAQRLKRAGGSDAAKE
jgi:hypothetical protein